MKENDDVIQGVPMFHRWKTKIVGKGDYQKSITVKECTGKEGGSWPNKYMTDEKLLHEVKACPRCLEKGEVMMPDLSKPRPKVHKPTPVPMIQQRRGLFLSDF
ncbi:MAG: hypothetical protein GOVbin1511_6 [Prokaryotic dsDNA virus sp.]|jgi:hypothetical protein|nr:MAG: hypothetical protein GOVbin1511_6 [Prokaryotic dsDNA virus sp.]|tara:strand:+ start:404 stop:712 length:309 start_codon:yes stop_codon:yes gene_type:complete